MVFQDISDRDDDDEHVGIDEIGIGSFPAPDRTGTGHASPTWYFAEPGLPAGWKGRQVEPSLGFGFLAFRGP